MSPIPTVSPASGQLRHSRTHDSFQTPPAATPSPHPSTTSAPAAASSSSTPPPKSSPSSPSSYYGSKEHSAQKHRAKLNRFMTLLEDHTTDLAALRRQSWTGIPRQVRSVVWQLLLGYLPANRSRRQPTLARKRAEYVQYAEQYYDEVDESSRTSAELEILHQIRVDVPRTCPSLAMFQTPQVQHSLERVLYVWAVRHPASGYVQGINDICTPFFVLFFVAITGIGAATTLEDEDDAEWLEFTRLITPDLIERVSPDQFLMVEADCFWCLSKLIDGIQDNYTFAQPGIQKMVFKLQELVLRIDASLHQHLADENVQFMQFAFRWMNCLLHRELSLPLIVRAWDTYLAQPGGDGFKEFHVYMCAAFLMHFASELKAMEFQELVVFLQNLPTEQWTFKELETLIAQAYVYQSLFHNAPKHLEG